MLYCMGGILSALTVQLGASDNNFIQLYIALQYITNLASGHVFPLVELVHLTKDHGSKNIYLLSILRGTGLGLSFIT